MIFANVFLFSSHTTNVMYNFYEIFAKIPKTFSIIVYKDLKIHKEFKRTMDTQTILRKKTKLKISNCLISISTTKMQQFA